MANTLIILCWLKILKNQKIYELKIGQIKMQKLIQISMTILIILSQIIVVATNKIQMNPKN